MSDDNVIYANCIARIRNRLNVVDDVLSGRMNIMNQDVLVEVIFVQFRKSLEEVAFASLSANKDVYSAVHAKFSLQLLGLPAQLRFRPLLIPQRHEPVGFPPSLRAPKRTPFCRRSTAHERLLKLIAALEVETIAPGYEDLVFHLREEAAQFLNPITVDQVRDFPEPLRG